MNGETSVIPSPEPVPGGFFALPDDNHSEPRLLGSYSPSGDLYFFPRRRVCPVTLSAVQDCVLSSHGTLFSWTYVCENRLGRDARGTGGYGVGQIDLPEGPRIQARLVGEQGDWTIGMVMELTVIPLDEGRVTFAFRIASSA